jgi:lysozyme family protein
MAALSNEFLFAFSNAMFYEVGSFWDPHDPEVQAGLIATTNQKRKVGYVNIPADSGGETKFGIAKNSHRDVDIKTLDLSRTIDIYFDEYWIGGKCDKLPQPLTIIHFDGCCNHGVSRACKFLQKAAGVTADGDIGPATLRAVGAMNQEQLIRNLSQIRENFYNAIVQRDPSQSIFLKGWLRRIKEVTDLTLSQL